MTESIDPEPGPLSAAFVGIVGVGGVVGTAARYALARWLPAGTGFPWGTFLANLVGALILGVLLEQLTRRGPDVGTRRRLRLLIGTGVCGGLTTYSTFAVETDLLFRAHNDGLAITYPLVTVIAGILVARVGIAVGSRVRRSAA